MPQQWNPNSPGKLGLEYQPTEAGAAALGGALNFNAAAMRLLSHAAETIQDVRVYLSASTVAGASSVPLQGGGRKLVMDVYDEAAGVDHGGQATTEYTPNGTGSTSGVTLVGGASAHAILAGPATSGEYVELAAQGFVELEYDTAAFVGRMAYFNLEGMRGGGVGANAQVVAEVINGGNAYRLGEATAQAGGAEASTIPVPSELLERNPVTGRSWTRDEVRAFDTATYRVRITNTSKVVSVRLYLAQLHAVFYSVDMRVATGLLTPLGGAAWHTIALRNVTTGAANWAKANALGYLFVLRNEVTNVDGTPATASWSWIRGTSLPTAVCGAAGGGITAMVLTGPPSSIHGVSLGATDVGAVLPILARTTVPANSNDSQPYGVLATTDEVRSGAGTMQQEFQGAVGTYGILTVVVKPANGGVPAANLVLEVRQRSNSALFGTATITPAMLATGTPLAGGWTAIQVRAAASFALTAIKYYVDYTSTAAAGQGWLLARPHSGAAGVGGDVTFQGTTDVARVSGVDQDTSDFPVTVATVPATPAGFTATATNLAVGTAGGCIPGTMPYTALGWTATALGSSFLRYELERSEDAGATWQAFATVVPEITNTAKDTESLLGSAVRYRMRVVRTDGTASDYTAVQTVTLDPECVLYFSSNQDQGATALAYTEVSDRLPHVRDYEFLDAGDRVLAKMYGRDRLVAFQPTERRGVRFRRQLLVGAEVPRSTPEMDPFAALRALSTDSGLPYVCVRDSHGDRWFASVAVPEGSVANPGSMFYAAIDVVEVAAEPTVTALGA